MKNSLKTIKRYCKNPSFIIGLCVLIAIVLLSIFAPVLAPNNPNETNIIARFQSPSAEYPLGTDELGRCLLSRIMYGGSTTMWLSLVSLTIALFLGIFFGLIAGYYRLCDTPIMRMMDIFMAFPSMLLAIVIVAILGAGTFNVTIAIGIGTMPAFARLVRGQVLSLKNAQYIDAARIAGAGDFRIMFKHILPNCISQIVVYASSQMSWIIISVSTLSFLGLGVQPPTPEWGAIASGGKNYLRIAPHISFFPVIFIFIVVLALNLMGDGLRDELEHGSE